MEIVHSLYLRYLNNLVNGTVCETIKSPRAIRVNCQGHDALCCDVRPFSSRRRCMCALVGHGYLASGG